jgi:lipopolysaccharide assembly protein B
MDFDSQWFLLALPLAFALGWLGSRLDLRQQRRESRDAPRAYFKGLNLLLNEQHDKAIDVFIEAVQQDPDTSDLHFALGNLFRRRGEYERAVRVHEHLLQRADLPRGERERAQHALAQDFMKAGLFDRAEAAYRALSDSAFATDAQLALLGLYERSRQWRQAIEVARKLESSGLGSFATRMAHHWCELAQEADTATSADVGSGNRTGTDVNAGAALAEARKVSPLSPRPLVMLGERAAAAGDALAAVAAWNELLAMSPQAFGLVALRYAEQARKAGVSTAAALKLEEAYRRDATIDLLLALNTVDADPARVRERLDHHLREQATLGAAQAWVKALPADERAAHEAMAQALAKAARPLQRYRCAACGFEAQGHFWQCPGCLSWDSMPPRRIEET